MRYLFSVVAILLAAAARVWLCPNPSITPFDPFYFTIALVAFLAGGGPGLLATIGSTIIGNYILFGFYGQSLFTRRLLFSITLFTFSAGAIAFICASLRKALLSSRRQAELLRVAEERAAFIARLSEENPDPTIRLSGPEFTVTYANRTAHAHLQDLMFKEGLPAPLALLAPARRATAEHEPVRVDLHSGGRLFALHFVPLETEVNVYGQDVTERELATASLRKSEQRLRGLFEKAAVGILELDPGDHLIETNERFCLLLGYRRDELLAKSIYDLTAPEDQGQTAEIHRQVHTGAFDFVDYEKDYLRRDGTRLSAHVTVAAIREADGRFASSIATVADISARKAAEADRERLIAHLQEVDQRKSDFLGVLSHELRNPLAPISNSVYVLTHAEPSGDQARRALAVIDRQVRQLTRLTDDLLDVTRIARGKVRLQRERIDLNEMARHAVADQQQLFLDAGVGLTCAVGEEPIPVNADPIRLQQVLGNLLRNAAKFAPRGAQAALSIERTHNDTAIIRVKDTGFGISPELLTHLFEPFMQAEKTLDRNTGGLGLGLALVKGLVELHGGSVSAHSEGVGRGATFTIRLPMERRLLTPASAPPPLTEPRPSHRILVIEDNIDSALSIKEVLELNEHIVEVAHNGPDGLEKVHTFRPDVVLCDIGLPGMDGFEVARALRHDPTIGELSLIALSGYAQAEDIEKAKEAGFDLHLAKPPDLDMLERVMGSAHAATSLH